MNKKFISNKELEKYKKFALKEDMLKMSIAFILGAAFNNVVKGISDLLIMPFINFILLHTGESWRSFEVEPADGLVLELGKFLGTCVDFVLISIILYVLYMKILKNIKLREEVEIKCLETKVCPLCKSTIHYLATKCPECTGDLDLGDINEQS